MSSTAGDINNIQRIQGQAFDLAPKIYNAVGGIDSAEQNAGESAAGAYAPNPVDESFILDELEYADNVGIPQLAAKIFGVLYQSSEASKKTKDKGAAAAMQAQAQKILQEMGKKAKELFEQKVAQKAERLNFLAISEEGEKTIQRMFGASIAGSQGLSAQLRDSMVSLANDYNSTPSDPYVNSVDVTS